MNLTLQAIRRKVDRATKRADAASEESIRQASQEGPTSKACVACIGSMMYVKGQYSFIFPASVGPTVETMVRPQINDTHIDTALRSLIPKL